MKNLNILVLLQQSPMTTTSSTIEESATTSSIVSTATVGTNTVSNSTTQTAAPLPTKSSAPNNLTNSLLSSTPTTPSIPASPAVKSISSPAPGSIEASLLANQPPGTVLKTVTAQVIQTTQGPRIVLQGLQGSDFTPQQLALVHNQVKQQLIQTQATAGKQAALGPTKIYLAVQPPPGNQIQQNQIPQTPTTNAASTGSSTLEQNSVQENLMPSETGNIASKYLNS